MDISEETIEKHKALVGHYGELVNKEYVDTAIAKVSDDSVSVIAPLTI